MHDHDETKPENKELTDLQEQIPSESPRRNAATGKKDAPEKKAAGDDDEFEYDENGEIVIPEPEFDEDDDFTDDDSEDEEPEEDEEGDDDGKSDDEEDDDEEDDDEEDNDEESEGEESDGKEAEGA